jgi:sugar/nucleoside kinase (ribokinase family)
MPMPMSVPQLLVLGHVTCDELGGGQTRLGGAASYAALAAARLGVETGLVTVAPPGHPLLAQLRTAPRLSLVCAPSEVITTFALDYRGPRRSLALRACARPLVPGDIPEAWRSAPAAAYIGPVAGECDRALIEQLAARFIGVGLQGWLRRAGPDGAIQPALSDEAVRPPPVQLAVVSEEDHPEVDAIAARFAAAGATVAITRGARGATLISGRARIEVLPAPAHEIDPTGAGDVFGVVLTWRLAAGDPPATAASAAASAAARVVEGPGLGRLG